MRILLFLMTYLFGLSTIFIEVDYALLYFVLFGFYISLFYNVKEESFTRFVLEPFVLAMASAFFIYVLHGMNVFAQGVFLFSVVFVFIAAKIKKERTENNGLYLIEYFFLPFAAPISLCFIVSLMIPSEIVAATLYVFVYYLLLAYLLKGVPTISYTIIVLIVQNSMFAYLYPYLSFIPFLEKIIFLMVINGLLVFNGYKRVRRGKRSLFINKEEVA